MRGAGPPLPSTFWRAGSVVLVARAAQFVEAFLPLLFLQSLGAGPGATAVVLVAQQAASTAAYAVEGRLVRRLGLTRVLRWGLAGSAVAVGMLAQAESTLVGGIAAATFGATSGAWRAAVQAMVPAILIADTPAADAAPALDGGGSDLRSRAYGALFLVANVGAIASAAAGAAGLPLRALFTIQAGTTAGAFLLTWILPRGLGAVDSLPRVPESKQPTAADVRRARRQTRLMMVAFVPATMLMFQAFGGLAVSMPAGDYRVMVLVNAVTLVVAQPFITPLLRVLGASVASIAAIIAMAVGIAAQTFWPDAHGWTVLWTLGELLVVIVPGALVAAAAPTAQVADHVGRFQVAQGVAAAVALYGGPLLAGAGATPFALACLVCGAIGVISVLIARRSILAAWEQPLACPCGALFCVCSNTHTACASPSPILTHQAIPATDGDPRAPSRG